MKKSKILTICASALLMSAYVFGSMKLWASDPEAEGYVENVYALERSGFFMTCYGSAGACNGVCIQCGYCYGNASGEFGRFGGSCPLCNYNYDK